MKGFVYNGKSTEDILSVPLILATFDSQEAIIGVSKEDNIGTQTITRESPNEYGSVNTLPSFSYGLIKSDKTCFTDEEQRIVETWLTSPRYSQELKITGDSDSPFFYKGRFTETDWNIGGNGWAGAMFTFTCATAYPYKKYSHSYDISGETNVRINCLTDERDIYVYPTVKFTNSTSSSTGLAKDINFKIKSATDNNNEMKAIVQNGMTIAFDCQHCIPWNYLVVDNNSSRSECPYSDLGWDDIGNIYWARLLYGNNDWVVTGNGTLTVEYNCPYKRVGGWL